MSLERAYKNCQECCEYHSGAEQIIKDKSIGRILNGVNTNEVILGISSLFISAYLRNEAMKALEENTNLEHSKTALKICVSCDYTAPHVAEYLKTTKDINLMNIN